MKQNLQILLAAMSTLMILNVSGQSKMSRYQKNLLYEADIYFVQGDFYYAAELYTELSQADPSDEAILGKLGICYFNLPTMKGQAKEYLELAAKGGDTESLFYLAKSRIEEYKFFDAIALIDSYSEKADRTTPQAEIEHLHTMAERAIKMVKAPMPVRIKNLGTSVNTALHDYAPVWDSHGENIYFTSRRRYDDESQKDISEQYDENIYFVDLNSDPLKAHAAEAPLNTRTNDAAVACSPDGKSLIIFRTSKDGFSGDLYITEKKLYVWADVEKLDQSVNSKYQEASACFGDQDGSILFFSSDRPGGFGGKDIYRVRRLPNGTWGEAENLGEEINTSFDEDAPFIAADGALYFSSKGHENMGGFDIFCSTLKDEGFESPRNIGYPINTPGDDIFFVLDATGKMAYFSSERMGGYGLQDIYRVEFDDSNTIIFKGALVNSFEGNLGAATVTLLNEDDGSVEGLYQTDPALGTFIMALNTNKKYTFLVEADGYKTLEKSVYYGAELDGVKEVSEELTLMK